MARVAREGLRVHRRGGPEGGRSDRRPAAVVTARGALRTLVQKVETYADPEIEGSEARAAFLERQTC